MLLLFTDFTDAAEYWMFPYESPNFQQDIEEVWEMIRPLYEELHAYVRRKLRELYGPEKIGGHAPLPSHILGKINIMHMYYKYNSNSIIFISIRQLFLNINKLFKFKYCLLLCN